MISRFKIPAVVPPDSAHIAAEAAWPRPAHGWNRLFFIQLYRWFPSVLKAITIARPETLVRWHRAGFRRYWRWKSRSLGGRPQIDVDLRFVCRLSRAADSARNFR